MSQAGIINIIENNPDIPTSFVTDSGTAVPILNEIEILGDSTYISTSAVNNVITITFDNSTFGQTITGDDSVALSPTANNWNILTNVVAAGTDPFANSGAGSTLTFAIQISQALAATDATKIGLCNFDNTAFSVDPNGFVTLVGGGSAACKFDVNTAVLPGVDPVTPDGSGIVIVNGTAVANASTPVQTITRALNTYNIEVQYGAANATTDASKSGLVHFDSSMFSVDGNGFVTLAGGGLAVDEFTVDSTSGTGVNPVKPNASGNITITGGQVATGIVGTNVIRLNTNAPNQYTVEIQRTTAVAATDVTKNGVAHFNSDQFSVDSNGFVSLAGGSVAIDSVTVDSVSGGGVNPVVPTALGNITIKGRQGCQTTSTAANEITINAPPFTSTTALTMSINNGYFATAAGTYNLPSTTESGSLITVFCDVSGVIIDAPASRYIQVGTLTTSASGTITSTATGDSVTLRYRNSTGTWYAVAVIGTWTVA